MHDALPATLLCRLRMLLLFLALMAPPAAYGGVAADTARSRPRPLPRLGWIMVTDPRGAFEVAMPPDTQSVVVRTPKSRGDSVELHLLTAALPDRSQFAAVYSDPVADVVILDEEASLAAMRRRLLAAMSGVVLRTVPVRVDGFPGSDVMIAVDEHQRVYCRVVQRGDRTYGLVAKVGDARSDSVTAIAMLNSLRFLPPSAAAWRPFTSADLSFRASFPAEPVVVDRNDILLGRVSLSPWRHATEVYARDPGSGLLYTVLATKFDEAYRDDDTLALFGHIEQDLLGESDSVVSRRDVRVDGFPAREITTRNGRNHALRRIRMVLHGEDFFTLSLVAPPAAIASPAADAFFESFHTVGAARPVDLFTSRLAEVITTIDDRDPAASARALAALDAMHLGARDRPDMYRLLDHPRPDDSLGPRSVRGILIRGLSASPDEKTVPFLTRLVGEIAGAEDLRIAAITYIAWIGTPAALDTAAVLIDRYREDFEQREIDPFRTVRDTIGEVASALPGYFEMLDVPGLRGTLLALAETLERRGDTATLQRVSTSFVRGAAQALEHGGRDLAVRVVEIASRMPKSQPVDALLRALAASRDRDLARSAIVGLVRRRAALPDSLVDAVAADTRQTMLLYRDLAALHRADVLPARYRDQRLIAASTVIVHLEAESPVRIDSVSLEDARELTYRGAARRFFLFRTMRAGDSAWHPAVTGPFSTDPSSLDPESAGVWTSTDAFDPVAAPRYYESALRSIGVK